MAKDQKTESKAKEPKAIARQEPGFFQRIVNGIKRFFRETVGELKKVTWPTRREALNLTGIVLVVIFAVGLFLGFWDVVFAEMFGLIFSLF